jgi:hypothetical protein
MDFISPLQRIAGALERVTDLGPEKQIDQKASIDSAPVQERDAQSCSS